MSEPCNNQLNIVNMMMRMWIAWVLNKGLRQGCQIKGECMYSFACCSPVHVFDWLDNIRMMYVTSEAQ